MGGIKNRGTQVHKVKTKYKRNKKVEIPISKNSDDNFLEKTLAHIPEYFGKYGVQLMEYDYSGEEVRNLLVESFERNGTEGLIKAMEDHNYFMVFVDDSLPSNYSLVSDKNWCIWFWNNFDIEEYTFFVIDFPCEFKIYKHFISSSTRMNGEAKSLEISQLNKNVDLEKIFSKTVKDYMTSVFWSELDFRLEDDNAAQSFFDAMDDGEFSEDFSTGGFFNFEGIDFSKKMTEKAFEKIKESSQSLLE